MWAKLLEAVADKPAMTWVRSLDVLKLAGSTLELVARPGQRDIVAFVSDSRRAQLAELMESATGRRLRIGVSASGHTPGASGDRSPDSGPEAGDAGHDAGGASRISQEQWAKAGTLPLVKQVVEVFDGASTVGVATEYNDAEQPGSDVDAVGDDPDNEGDQDDA